MPLKEEGHGITDLVPFQPANLSGKVVDTGSECGRKKGVDSFFELSVPKQYVKHSQQIKSSETD